MGILKTRGWCKWKPHPYTSVAHLELLCTLLKEPRLVLEICCVDVELMLLWPDAPSLRTHITSLRDWFKRDCVGGRNPSYLCLQTALINSSAEFTPGPPVLWGIYERDTVSWCRYLFWWWECDSFFFKHLLHGWDVIEKITESHQRLTRPKKCHQNAT